MKSATVLVIGLASCLFLGSCYSRMDYARQSYLAKGLKERADALQQDHDQLEAQNALLRSQVDSLQKDAAYVQAQKKKFAELEKKLAGLEIPATTKRGLSVIRDASGHTGVRMDSELLFASGSNKIGSEGRKVLKDILTLVQGKRLRVDGHTDSDPIQHSKWGSNLELSMARSLAVANVLMQLGVAEDQLTLGGLGMTQPTGADKAKNRRVEIWMLN